VRQEFKLSIVSKRERVASILEEMLSEPNTKINPNSLAKRAGMSHVNLKKHYSQLYDQAALIKQQRKAQTHVKKLEETAASRLARIKTLEKKLAQQTEPSNTDYEQQITAKFMELYRAYDDLRVKYDALQHKISSEYCDPETGELTRGNWDKS